MGKDLRGRELGVGIHQRPDGRYQGRYVDRFGQRKSIYSVDLSMLRDKLNTAIYEDKKNMSVVDEKATLDYYFTIWLDVHKYGVIRENTRNGYIIVYNKHIKPVLGHVKLVDITQLRIKALLRDMDKAGLGFVTRDRVRILLLDLCGKAIEDNLLVRNPAKGIKLNRDDKKEIRVLSLQEQQDFFECAAGTFYYNMFTMACESGLRPGELFALTVQDLDFEACVINVDKTLLYNRYEYEETKSYKVGPPKTKSSVRKVPMTDKCKQVAEKQIVLRNIILRKTKKKLPENLGELLFVTSTGNPINDTTYNDNINKILDRINIMRDPLEEMEHFSGHCFRHTFATRCFEAGIQPKTIQKYLGHATLQMTMDLYVHVTDELMHDEIHKLEI